ncbi:hypothetical protein HanIR_Chr09g0414971 [Helianthus annuus]|nr:hypothetical protein HanIR_Chr09g0414971 [Helianthus annuus]
MTLLDSAKTHSSSSSKSLSSIIFSNATNSALAEVTSPSSLSFISSLHSKIRLLMNLSLLLKQISGGPTPKNSKAARETVSSNPGLPSHELKHRKGFGPKLEDFVDNNKGLWSEYKLGRARRQAVGHLEKKSELTRILSILLIFLPLSTHLVNCLSCILYSRRLELKMKALKLLAHRGLNKVFWRSSGYLTALKSPIKTKKPVTPETNPSR